MTKKDSKVIGLYGMVAHIQKKHGTIDKDFEWIDRKTIEFVLRAFFERTLSLVKHGHRVVLPEFGVFSPGETAKRHYKVPDGNLGKGGKPTVKFKVTIKYRRQK
jgi:nucleoid DNA-binding protein